MRRNKVSLFTFFLLTFSIYSFSQSICGTSPEGGTVVLTAPSGYVFTSVTFASYGTPNGSCGSFTIGGCHAANSKTIVEGILLGNNSGSIGANNGVFGDPCGGTFKRLYIEAVYSLALPLRVISFSGSANGNSASLKWKTTNEVNTKQFDVQRSSDGITFLNAGIVLANNRSGDNDYAFTDNNLPPETQFYRLKMIDIDGAFVYSNIVRLESSSSNRFTVFPNPAINSITVGGLHSKGLIEISDIQGRVLKKINVSAQTQTINIDDFAKGMYVLRYSFDNNTICEKIVKE